MGSIDNIHAKLAADGINILNVTVDQSGSKYAVFEYSWNDPKQDGKLHWSRSVVAAYNMADLFSKIMREAIEARRELERGE